MQLRRCDQLLAQIRRRVDQEPVFAAGADCNRCLAALQSGAPGACRLTDRATTIPLRNATAGRGSQNDDAKHDSSPGDASSISEATAKRYAPPRYRDVAQVRSASVKCFS